MAQQLLQLRVIQLNQNQQKQLQQNQADIEQPLYSKRQSNFIRLSLIVINIHIITSKQISKKFIQKMKLAVLKQTTQQKQHANQSPQPPIIHHSCYFNNLNPRRTHQSTNTIKGPKNHNAIFISSNKTIENKAVKNTKKMRNESEGGIKSWRKRAKDNKEFNMTGNKIFNMRKFFETKNQKNSNQSNHYGNTMKIQNIFSEKSSPNKNSYIQENNQPHCQSHNSLKTTKNNLTLKNPRLFSLLMPNRSLHLNYHQLDNQKQNYSSSCIKQKQTQQAHLQSIKNPQLVQSRSQLAEQQKLKPMFIRQTLRNFDNAYLQTQHKCRQPKEKYGIKYIKCEKKAYNYNCYRYVSICYSDFNNGEENSNVRYKTLQNEYVDQSKFRNTKKQQESSLLNPNSHSLSPTHISLTPFSLSPKVQMKKHISRISELMARKYCGRYRPHHGFHNLDYRKK